MSKASLLSLALCAALSLPAVADTNIWFDTLPLEAVNQTWKEASRNKSIDGNPIKIGGKEFSRGVGTHAPSRILFNVGGQALSFDAEVGMDDEAEKEGCVSFAVYADDRLVAEAGPFAVEGGKQGPGHIHADLQGARIVELYADPRGTDVYDHCDWGEAFFTMKDGGEVKVASANNNQLGILTPPVSRKPRINGPKVVGVRPGSPLVWRLPVSGQRPMRLCVQDLPEGLDFDCRTGVLTGSFSKPGTNSLVFAACNCFGSTSGTVRFVVGDAIALTPPMGWNSWNCFAGKVTAADIRATADLLVSSGLADHGWNYVNIDDFWQNRPCEKHDQTLMGPERHEDGSIVVNSRFPDMKALADYVHAKGLRIGLYSSPGPYTCGRCTGSYGHEWQDARTYADWGYDYLKYDWCSYGDVATGEGKEYFTRPYTMMGEALRAQKRDILFSLCQYGWGDVSTWGREVKGSCWRTTGDITDNWLSMRGILDQQIPLWKYAGPDAWNDPDMLIVGYVGWGQPHPTHLSRNEQYTHMSMWAMLCSPLLLGCDLTKLDAFTLSLLTNDEVIEVSQDELGAQAALVGKGANSELWAKPMSDGSIVLALHNTALHPSYGEITADFRALGLEGSWLVRDLWRQFDVGVSYRSYSCIVPGHATQLVRLFPKEGAGLRKGLKDIRETPLCDLDRK